MSFTNTLTRYDAELVDLLARRPELRDVGIAGHLVDSALNDDGGAIRGWRWYLAFQDVDKGAA